MVDAKFAENWKRIAAGQKILTDHPFTSEINAGLTKWPEPRMQTQSPGSWVEVTCEPCRYGANAWAVSIAPNIRRRAEPEQWAYVIGRTWLHIAMNHLDPARDDLAWHMACWAIADNLMAAAGVGRRPEELNSLPAGYSLRSETELAVRIRSRCDKDAFAGLSLGSIGRPFWSFAAGLALDDGRRVDHQASLARAVRQAAIAAVEVAGGRRASITAKKDPSLACKEAMSWVISEYPLLSALGAAFTLIEDEEVCARLEVPVAAVYAATREIYVNPRALLTKSELVFVLAHELLHVGLRHNVRTRGRDHYLWNVACDYVINGWLLEMRVGEPPRCGYLHDPEVAGLSAEDIYDRITADLRWRRRLAKSRDWAGNGDMRDDRPPVWWSAGEGTDLDAFYRRALADGHRLHERHGRGLLPAGLVEEIRALEHPPIPWDVKLAHWLDAFFPPVERKRSYARLSRRQSATPDIPRPVWITPDEEAASRTFGVVLDTSISMDRRLLGMALGAIASYALSRDVTSVRLIECDAHPYDKGYVTPESLSDSVEVRGRGGTVLQPAFGVLDRDESFPRSGPVLVITDGVIDNLRTARDHAFLMPEGARLPFRPDGPVFAFE